jgi:uncharacterized protein (DUF302 family)
MHPPEYGMTRSLPGGSFDDAVTRVTEALNTEGFGVLTRIDVDETLKTRMGVAFPRYVILGACNPPLAHAILEDEPWAGLLLPCNVVVRAVGDGDSAVSILDPKAMFRLVENPDLTQAVQEVADRLNRVLTRI